MTVMVPWLVAGGWVADFGDETAATWICTLLV